MTQVMQIPDGYRGFDCNNPLSQAQAVSAAAKYKFVGRYVPRVTRRSYDLTPGEVGRLIDAGLGVFAVQHVESDTSWVPTRGNGTLYGKTAVSEARACGLLPGVSVACDLEGVAEGTTSQTVIDYLTAWFAPVRDAGFRATLYVGWHHVLSADDLFYKVPFTRYWGALNLNADQFPVKRGLAMKQHQEKAGDRPAGITFPIDTNTAQADALGGRMTVLAPDEWGVPG